MTKENTIIVDGAGDSAAITRKNVTVIIFAGARFSTSDYGNGSVDMRSFLLNGACLNGMVRESVPCKSSEAVKKILRMILN